MPQVATFFGLTSAGIVEWRKDGMPGRPGRWDLAEITQWRIGRIRGIKEAGEEKRRREKPKPRPEIDEELSTVKAAILRLRFRREEGAYITAEESESQVSDLHLTFRWDQDPHRHQKQDVRGHHYMVHGEVWTYR